LLDQLIQVFRDTQGGEGSLDDHLAFDATAQRLLSCDCPLPSTVGYSKILDTAVAMEAARARPCRQRRERESVGQRPKSGYGACAAERCMA
jgi:hypothetical protein